MSSNRQRLRALILYKWDHEWDARLKGHIERIADEIGCDWWEIVMECPDLFLTETGFDWTLCD